MKTEHLYGHQWHCVRTGTSPPWEVQAVCTLLTEPPQLPAVEFGAEQGSGPMVDELVGGSILVLGYFLCCPSS